MAVSVPLAMAASIPLPPGFKFNPTDEEIVVHYLRCRAVKQPLPSAFITDKDVLNHNPWELVPEGASEKYFFHCRVTRWATSSRWMRATKDGFWKASGKEVPIFCSRIRSRIPILVGSKRIQVFYLGKAPAGQRTEWVMEEYRLAGAGLGPYRAVPPNTNQNLRQTSCITYVDGKKHDNPAGTLRGTAPSITNTAIVLHPDQSWVVCRIHKRRNRAPRTVARSSTSGETKIHFFNFLGQGNLDPSTLSATRLLDPHMEIENSEMEGNGGSSENASTRNGN